MKTFILLFALNLAPLTRSQIDEIRRLEHRLMAPCCYSQTIDVHMSQEAFDMRSEVEAMVAAGKSESEIVAYYKAKYGETILVVPDGAAGKVAFAVPVLAALIGTIFLSWFLRRGIPVNSSASAVALPAPELPPAELIHKIRSEVGDV